MKKITSAYANKMLRSLEEDKAFWVNKEAASNTYVAAVNEEPVIPEYDYMTPLQIQLTRLTGRLLLSNIH